MTVSNSLSGDQSSSRALSVAIRRIYGHGSIHESKHTIKSNAWNRYSIGRDTS